MNPADLAQSDLSIWALFLQAHWMVKSVTVGLIFCSIWVWAIAVDKFILYARTSRAMQYCFTSGVCGSSWLPSVVMALQMP